MEDVLAILIPIIAMFIPIVAIIMSYYEKKAKMKVLERAIEKGVEINNLDLGDYSHPKFPYRSGMIALSCGIGIIIFGIFFGMIGGENSIPEIGSSITMYVLIGSGAIVALIGAALIANDRMNISRYESNHPKNQKIQ